MTENELRSAALDYGCPECGAVVGKRCRMENKTPNAPNYPPSRRYVTVRKHPHGERVTLAWRAYLVRDE
jgi:hypothetical protein